LINSGTMVVASAGNGATEASTRSPARVVQVFTVGAADITNAFAWFSNFGEDVDLFGPGVDITSAWIDGPSDTHMESGTSMAAAHVAGVAACFLSADTTMTPLQISTEIWDLAINGAISGVPDETVDTALFNGFEE
jgi:subtilisin family serine protease